MNDYQYTTAELMLNASFRAWVYKTDEVAVRQWDNWMLAHPEQQPLVEEARTLLLHLQVKNEAPAAREKEQVKQRLDRRLDAQHTRGRVVQLRKWAAIAASVLVVCGMMTYYFLAGQDMQVTDYAATRTVKLPDGSTVLMNAHSSIRYKKHWFSWKEREVWLDGEAFFTVTKKPAGYHPKFVVHAQGLDVNVVGTEFNVYNRHNRVNVVLEQGKVIATGTGSAAAAGTYTMHPGQWLQLQDNQLTAREVDPSVYSPWRYHRLSFNNRPLAEVIQVLEDNYGYQISWKNANHLQENFTGSCPSDNAPLLLQAIGSVFNMRMTLHDKTVVFE